MKGTKRTEEQLARMRANCRRGPEHRSWNGGRKVDKQGYVYIWFGKGEHPMADANGYVAEHRLVMARSLGRALETREQVHHVNGDRGDNRIENLQLRSTYHGPGQRHVCRACGSHDIAAIGL